MRRDMSLRECLGNKKLAPLDPCTTTWLPLPLDLFLADFRMGIFVMRHMVDTTCSSS